jgi:hypothetical protein
MTLKSFFFPEPSLPEGAIMLTASKLSNAVVDHLKAKLAAPGKVGDAATIKAELDSILKTVEFVTGLLEAGHPAIQELNTLATELQSFIDNSSLVTTLLNLLFPARTGSSAEMRR